MDLSQFMIMKHELLLTIIAMVLLVAEISFDNKKKVIPLAILLSLMNITKAINRLNGNQKK